MLSNRTLYTHTGRKVRFYDDLVRGRVITLNVAYTRCTLNCPTGFATLRAVQDLLGDACGRDVRMYTLTLDPEHDTPAVLRRAHREYGAGPGWTFLTGSEGAVEEVRRGLGLYDPDPRLDADRSRHSGLLVMGNDPLERWCAVPLGFKPEQIVESLRRVREPVNRW
ncbi:MAG TPA: SCO family protein [Candidatus Eisenbacteria bacterium]|jgi:protein SCO1/2